MVVYSDPGKGRCGKRQQNQIERLGPFIDPEQEVRLAVQYLVEWFSGAYLGWFWFVSFCS